MSELRVSIEGQTPVVMGPGDVLDLGEGGLVKYYPPAEAAAIRIFIASQQAEVRQAVAFVWREAGRVHGTVLPSGDGER